MKRILCILLVLCLLLPLAGCGRSRFRYGINTIEVLVSQDYSLAFRNNDPLYFYVTAALSVLAAEGRVDQLANKWLGSPALNYAKQADALELLVPPEPQDLIIGLDINSFPFSYLSNGEYWGLDVELAMAVCEKLGWTLKMQPIEKENVYVELSSGNIDVAWGGIALCMWSSPPAISTWPGAASPWTRRRPNPASTRSTAPTSTMTSSLPRETVRPSGTRCASAAEKCACPPPRRPAPLWKWTLVLSSASARLRALPAARPSALNTCTRASAMWCSRTAPLWITLTVIDLRRREISPAAESLLPRWQTLIIYRSCYGLH